MIFYINKIFIELIYINFILSFFYSHFFTNHQNINTFLGRLPWPDDIDLDLSTELMNNNNYSK